MVLGGAVDGGKIYRQDYNVPAVQSDTSPNLSSATSRDDLTAGNVPRIGLPPPNSTASALRSRRNGFNHPLSRRELLPTTSSDAVVATITKWFGVPPGDLTGPTGVFPTLATAHPNGSNAKFMT